MSPRTSGGITNKPGARYTCLYPLCTGRFSPRVAFRYFISDSFSVTSLLLTWLFYIAFSLFQSSLSTPFAAKSGLTTPDTALPILRSNYFTLLLYHLHYNMFSFHVLNLMAKAKNRKRLNTANRKELKIYIAKSRNLGIRIQIRTQRIASDFRI